MATAQSLNITTDVIEKKLVPASVFHRMENKYHFVKEHSLDQIKKWQKIALECENTHKTHDKSGNKVQEEDDDLIVHGKADDLTGHGITGIPETGDNIRERLVANAGLRDPLSIPETYIVNNPGDDDGKEDNSKLNEVTKNPGFVQHQSSYVSSHGAPKLKQNRETHSSTYKPRVRKNYQQKAKILLERLQGHGDLITWNDYGRISIKGNLIDATWDDILPALFSKNAVIHEDTNKVLEVICHLKCEDIITNPLLCENQRFNWFYLNY